MIKYLLLKNHRFFILIFCFFIIGCNKTSWYENYSKHSTEPFGVYILENEIDALFDGAKKTILHENIFDYLNQNYEGKALSKATYLCINDRAYNIDINAMNSLKDFVANGNEVFFALNEFNESIISSLQVKQTYLDDEIYTVNELKKLKGKLEFTEKSFNTKSFYYDRNFSRNYFSSYNTEVTEVLATQKINDSIVPVFIKVNHGKGAFYLHTHPIVFTNYNILNEKNIASVTNTFSYFKDTDQILWDTQVVKSKRSIDNKNTNSPSSSPSALSFFLANPSLKWSLGVAFFGLITFMLFNARRKQRVIPIIPKLENSTVNFIHTIANLYIDENNPKNLVDKKITYFFQYIRSKYLLNVNTLDDKFIKKLASKSGNTIQATKYLINTIISLNNRSSCTTDEMMRLNTQIENFFNTSKKT